MRDRYASLREGLVGAWIPSVSGSGLLLPDLSGHGNSGTLTNMGPEDWVSGQYGRALDFDGVDDGIYIGIDDFGKNHTSGSIAYWFSTTTTASNANAFTSAYEGGTSNYLMTRFNAGAIEFFQFNNDGTPDQIRTSATFNDGLWRHCVVLSTGSEYQIFVDGTSQSFSVVSGSNNGDWFADTSLRNNITFAYRSQSTDINYYDGQLDDIRIYNRALSEPEIKLLASRPGIGLRPQRRTMYYAPPTGARRRRILTSMP